jgi:hypothetical protein
MADLAEFKRKLDHGEPCGGVTGVRAAQLTALGVKWSMEFSDSEWRTRCLA